MPAESAVEIEARAAGYGGGMGAWEAEEQILKCIPCNTLKRSV